MHVELQVENKRSNVKRLVIRSQAVIGRQEHCDIRVISDEISREHCRISVLPHGAVLIDLGSTNGTFLNKKRIDSRVEAPLQDDDTIHVGPAAFVVRLVDVKLQDETLTANDETLASSHGNTQQTDEADAAAALAMMALSSEDDELALSSQDEELVELEEEDSHDTYHDPDCEQDDEELLYDSSEAGCDEEAQPEPPLTETEDEGPMLAEVTSDGDMSTLSEDDAFEKYLKNL